MNLDVRVGNDAAMTLYRRQGFVDTGAKPRASDDEPPERTMTRFLN